MNLQKRLASSILKCSPKRIYLDPSKATDIKESITKEDVRALIKKGIILEKQKQGISQSRTRKIKMQKRKGRQQGQGSRKGKHNARLADKDVWIATSRLQRAFLQNLRNNKRITTKDYRILYAKSKGGFFRSLHHMKTYMTEQTLIKKR